jgi:hypothetical protein
MSVSESVIGEKLMCNDSAGVLYYFIHECYTL